MSLPQSGERANEIWTQEGTQYWLANLRRSSCRVLWPDILNLDHLPYFANLAIPSRICDAVSFRCVKEPPNGQP